MIKSFANIETPTIGEMLNEDYLIPMNLSASKLAKEIQVPVSRINSILRGGRISADTAVRLAKYFGTTDSFFMNLQADIDVRKARIAIASELEKIPVAVSF